MIEGPERESCIWRQSTLEFWAASFSGYTYVYCFTACFLGITNTPHEQSPSWGAHSTSACQKIFHIL